MYVIVRKGIKLFQIRRVFSEGGILCVVMERLNSYGALIFEVRSYETQSTILIIYIGLLLPN